MFNQHRIFFLSALSSDRFRFGFRKTVMALVVLLFLFPMVGCYSLKTYRGDGKLTKFKNRIPWFAPCTTYVLNLGPIDLTRKNKKVFTMQGLPHKWMGSSLNIRPVDPKVKISDIIDHMPNVLIRAELVDETTREARNTATRLNQMTWGSGGDESYISLEVGLQTETRNRYTLTIEVREADPKASNLNAEVVFLNSCSL